VIEHLPNTAKKENSKININSFNKDNNYFIREILLSSFCDGEIEAQ
jgi:hypothetical protein